MRQISQFVPQSLVVLAFSLLSSPLGFSQITISSSNMPKSGDTIRYSVATSIGSNELDQTGTNQVWDFTELSPVSQGIDEYVASYETPYILNFGFSAIGQKVLDTAGTSQFQLKNVYTFFRNSAASFTQVGIGFQFGSFPLPQAGKHSDPDEIYVFPLKFGNKDTTTFDVSVPIKLATLTVGTFTRTGTRYSVVDGWGKISTPYGNDIPCIRIKSVIVSNDSISVSMAGINFGTTTIRTEYKWLATSERIPVLEIAGNEIAGNFTPTEIRYRDNFRQIGPSDPVVADFYAENPVVQTGEVIRLVNQSSSNSQIYSWTVLPSGNEIFVNGTSSSSADPRIVINKAGFYSVRLIASGGGASDTTVKTEYLSVGQVGMEEIKSALIEIYPNPFNDQIAIQSKENSALKWVITDITGKEISGDFHNSERIKTGDWKPGMYILTIFDQNDGVILRRHLEKF
ncbi:MAG: T9SS type A sorting domain-containing protein [Bacteroidetes bacterium]|nr:T9SS type A sorting domain-containing protein [Bacteroidota bacterium]